MYDNCTERGGGPNNDEVVMVKMLVLQSWYGLSDLILKDKLLIVYSFKKFLGFPETPYISYLKFKINWGKLMRFKFFT